VRPHADDAAWGFDEHVLYGSLCQAISKNPAWIARYKGPWRPVNWDSTGNYEVPEWVLDAEFSIYARWGVYSVPALENEWHARRMDDKNDSTFEFHQKKYGEPSKLARSSKRTLWAFIRSNFACTCARRLTLKLSGFDAHKFRSF